MVVKDRSPPRRVCNVALELDSPVRRWQRTNLSDQLVRGPDGQDGYILPGSPSIPDQIVSDRSGYFDALDQADEACRAGGINVTTMEDLLGGMLARQLAGFYRSAGGNLPAGVDLDSL